MKMLLPRTPTIALAVLALAACGPRLMRPDAVERPPRAEAPSTGPDAAAGPSDDEARDRGGSDASARAPVVVQPGAPGEATRVLGPDALSSMERPGHTAADVRFMQGMIVHHEQALEMAALVADRTRDETITLLARRIAISQRDEIGLMERWLEARGEAAAGGHAHHGPMGSMPGMLTPEQMARLEAAEGEAFDRLFLELMIQHHEGALTMVGELFASPGGGQESDVFQFASHVDADQHIEIERMRRMLATSP